MDKTILCLANSFKHGGRCIAGIEVVVNNGILNIQRSNYGIPIWIRPVSHNVAGEVPLNDALGIDVLSVVRIFNVQYAGSGAHSEDYYYDRMEKIASINPSDRFLINYTDRWHSNIFGNRGRAVTPDSFASGSYSVMLIRTEGATVYLDNRFTPKPRIKFTHNSHEYDFPITDPQYLDRLRSNPTLYHDNYGVLYIVASLGVEHEGWHSKLAATIITPAINDIREQLSLQPTPPTSSPSSVTIPVTLLNTSSSNHNTEYNESSNTRVQRPFVTETKSNQSSKQNQTKLSHVNITAPISGYELSKPNSDTNNRISSSSSSSGGCYIATSVYGSYDCPEVWTLRRFRDKKLSKTCHGMLFINTYYAISPILVKWFGNTSWFKHLWRLPLDWLVKALNKRGFEDTPYYDRTF